MFVYEWTVLPRGLALSRAYSFWIRHERVPEYWELKQACAPDLVDFIDYVEALKYVDCSEKAEVALSLDEEGPAIALRTEGFLPELFNEWLHLRAWYMTHIEEIVWCTFPVFEWMVQRHFIAIVRREARTN